jgi:segregation and condensation protein B
MNEKNKVEALLFASGRKMNIEEISRLSGIRDQEKIRQAIDELKKEYESRGSSVMLFEENDGWKLNVKEHYLPTVQKIVTKTELDKPLMETLAVVAWKYPVLQATVIKIRHNKAYGHLKQLEEMGFITRSKYGRTKRITLTERFFDYFALPSKEKAQEAFKGKVPEDVKKSVEKIEKEIEESEKKAEEIRKKAEEAKKLAEEERKREEHIGKELDKMDEEEARPKPIPPKPVFKETNKEIRKELKQEQNQEDEEIQEIKKEEKDIEQEEKKDFYSGSEQ